jgi:hypothetical protein
MQKIFTTMIINDLSCQCPKYEYGDVFIIHMIIYYMYITDTGVSYDFPI